MAHADNKNLNSGKQYSRQIVNEIMNIVHTPQNASRRAGGSELSDRVKNLIALAAAITLQRDEELIGQVTKKCLQAGSKPEELLEVLRLAIIIAEIPAHKYREIIQHVIDDTGIEI